MLLGSLLYSKRVNWNEFYELYTSEWMGETMKRQPEKNTAWNKFVRENQMGEEGEGPSPVKRDVFVPTENILNFLDAHLGGLETHLD